MALGLEPGLPVPTTPTCPMKQAPWRQSSGGGDGNRGWILEAFKRQNQRDGCERERGSLRERRGVAWAGRGLGGA